MVAVVTCKHGRDLVNSLFIENIRYLREHWDVHLFMATTKAERFDDKWIHAFQHENRPLGKKWNAVFKMALDHREVNRFMGMGDDDLISQESFEALINHPSEHVGSKSVYFIEPKTKKAVLSSYHYDCDKLIGPGRTFSRNALEQSSRWCLFQLHRETNQGRAMHPAMTTLQLNTAQAKYMELRGVGKIIKGSETFQFFGDERNNGLDHTSDMNLVLSGFLPTAIKLPHEMVDVKTKENIWDFKRRARQRGSLVVKYEKAIEWLPESMLTKLRKIEKHG